MNRIGLVGVMAVVMAACGPGGPIGPVQPCTSIAVSSVEITVESKGGGRICDATVDARVDGTEPRPLSAFGAPCTYSGIRETSGAFRVTVVRAGFQTQTVDLTVASGACHVITERRTVVLEP